MEWVFGILAALALLALGTVAVFIGWYMHGKIRDEFRRS